jgi:hypothetical protein
MGTAEPYRHMLCCGSGALLLAIIFLNELIEKRFEKDEYFLRVLLKMIIVIKYNNV